MFTSELKNRLPSVRGRYVENVSLKAHTWFQVGGPAEILFKPADLEDLQHFLKYKPTDVPITLLGMGSNVLVRSGGIPGVVVRLGKGFSKLHVREDYLLEVGAGVLDRNIALTAAEHGIAGFEFLVGIPGTLGGAVRMNAGAYEQEIKDVLHF